MPTEYDNHPADGCIDSPFENWQHVKCWDHSRTMGIIIIFVKKEEVMILSIHEYGRLFEI